MLEKFHLKFDALQAYVASKSFSTPFKPPKKMELPEMKKTIKTSVKKAISGDFKDFVDNATLATLVFNEFKNKKNHSQDKALELLALVEGNY